MSALDWVIAAVVTSPAWVIGIREGMAEVRLLLFPSVPSRPAAERRRLAAGQMKAPQAKDLS